ncbi:hypothetical protein [Kineosporia succinea]|uniref:Uncharacterized protein n=1 Tax=Kineosporia succinea TaxID=84632 RepID=A0ABT9PAI8_9ACTN|nr:hypothetical protein [Kineosporia succinea]MDP9829439.1 hypothetical protein [Kineosporia succinea]
MADLDQLRGHIGSKPLNDRLSDLAQLLRNLRSHHRGRTLHISHRRQTPKLINQRRPSHIHIQARIRDAGAANARARGGRHAMQALLFVPSMSMPYRPSIAEVGT